MTGDQRDRLLDDLNASLSTSDTTEDKVINMRAAANSQSPSLAEEVAVQLDSESPVVQKTALRALADVGRPVTPQNLVGILSANRPFSVRNEAASQLGELPRIAGDVASTLFQQFARTDDNELPALLVEASGPHVGEHPELHQALVALFHASNDAKLQQSIGRYIAAVEL